VPAVEGAGIVSVTFPEAVAFAVARTLSWASRTAPRHQPLRPPAPIVMVIDSPGWKLVLLGSEPVTVAVTVPR
jgi:hypothetical protein